MLIIIPTYNEIENIEAIIRAVFSRDERFHILIVDDNSPDGTAAKVKALQTEFPTRLFLEVRTEKKGLGTAYIHGFEWALAHGYDYIFEMDCCNGSDVAIGSRYVKGVNVVNWPLPRILLSYGASIYVRIITGMKIKDPTAGFVCYKRQVLEAINLSSVRFVGYAFQIEMKYRAYLKKFKITEVPIIFTDRIRGKSKMNKSIIREAIFGVIGMRLKQ